jgi:hypothetical protein
VNEPGAPRWGRLYALVFVELLIVIALCGALGRVRL